MIPRIITDNSITVVLEGQVYTISDDHTNFEKVLAAVNEMDWDVIPGLCSLEQAIEKWSLGEFTFSDGRCTYKGAPLPEELSNRMWKMYEAGSDCQNLCNFYERLQANPSRRSVQTLYAFLEHENIPIDEEGYFYAYKGLRDDYRDVYSGKFDNSPGAVHSVPRNSVDDDPSVGCSYGFHVGSLEYAVGFGSRVVICKIDPADVVCVPYDCNFQKVRTAKYEVVCDYRGALPSTTVDSDIPDDYDYEEDDTEDAPVDERQERADILQDSLECLEDDLVWHAEQLQEAVEMGQHARAARLRNSIGYMEIQQSRWLLEL